MNASNRILNNVVSTRNRRNNDVRNSNDEYDRRLQVNINTIIRKYCKKKLTLTKEYLLIFKSSLVHHSYNSKDNYEIKEFLGDSIFHIILSEYLYNRYPEKDNTGFLTRLRSNSEKTQALSMFCSNLNLEIFIKLSNKIVLNDKIREDVFEAFIAAFYLCYGFGATKDLSIAILENFMNFTQAIVTDDNYKDILSRYYSISKQTPEYVTERVVIDSEIMYRTTIKNNKTLNKSSNDYVDTINTTGVGISRISSESIKMAEKNLLENLKIINSESVILDYSLFYDVDEVNVKPGSMLIYNVENKYITKTVIKNIFKRYNISLKNFEINKKLFIESTTHVSYCNNIKELSKRKLDEADMNIKRESIKLQDITYKRLKFLGDSVINFILAEYIYINFMSSEGNMSSMRTKFKNASVLSKMAKICGLHEYALISFNFQAIHNRDNEKINASLFQSFIGASYINFGLNVTDMLITSLIKKDLDLDGILDNNINYKDAVIQLFNNNNLSLPKYILTNEEGPSHNKLFTISITMYGNTYYGKGKSKAIAEQDAAAKLLTDNYNKLINEN